MKQIILMADIVDSHLKDQRQLMLDFKEIVKTTNQTFEHTILSPLTITLGDEFQGILNGIQAAVETIIFIEEQKIHRGKDFTLRYVINEGDVDTAINTAIAFEMLGQGLTDARYQLQKMKKESARFSITLDNNNLSALLNEAFFIFGGIVEKWNVERDYALASAFMQSDDYKVVAEKLGKERSLVWKRKKSLDIEAYNAIKNIIHLSIKTLT